jgi:phosphonate transport system substrate-binding protein
VALKFKKTYVGSTSNVMKTVMLGKADAGATLDVDLAQDPDGVNSQLRILLASPKCAPHPLSAHPRVPKKDRELVAKAVLKLGADDANSALLKSVRLPGPVPADYDRDYKELEEIDIRKLILE